MPEPVIIPKIPHDFPWKLPVMPANRDILAECRAYCQAQNELRRLQKSGEEGRVAVAQPSTQNKTVLPSSSREAVPAHRTPLNNGASSSASKATPPSSSQPPTKPSNATTAPAVVRPQVSTNVKTSNRSSINASKPAAGAHNAASVTQTPPPSGRGYAAPVSSQPQAKYTPSPLSQSHVARQDTPKKRVAAHPNASTNATTVNTASSIGPASNGTTVHRSATPSGRGYAPRVSSPLAPMVSTSANATNTIPSKASSMNPASNGATVSRSAAPSGRGYAPRVSSPLATPQDTQRNAATAGYTLSTSEQSLHTHAVSGSSYAAASSTATIPRSMAPVVNGYPSPISHQQTAEGYASFSPPRATSPVAINPTTSMNLQTLNGYPLPYSPQQSAEGYASFSSHRATSPVAFSPSASINPQVLNTNVMTGSASTAHYTTTTPHGFAASGMNYPSHLSPHSSVAPTNTTRPSSATGHPLSAAARSPNTHGSPASNYVTPISNRARTSRHTSPPLSNATSIRSQTIAMPAAPNMLMIPGPSIATNGYHTSWSEPATPQHEWNNLPWPLPPTQEQFSPTLSHNWTFDGQPTFGNGATSPPPYPPSQRAHSGYAPPSHHGTTHLPGQYTAEQMARPGMGRSQTDSCVAYPSPAPPSQDALGFSMYSSATPVPFSLKRKTPEEEPRETQNIKRRRATGTPVASSSASSRNSGNQFLKYCPCGKQWSTPKGYSDHLNKSCPENPNSRSSQRKKAREAAR